MSKIILEDRAISEVQEAYDYYEKQQIGLGERFKSELDRCINYIQKHPQHFKKVKKEIREALIHKFPNLVVYELIAEDIVIYAVFHAHRNPKEKLKK